MSAKPPLEEVPDLVLDDAPPRPSVPAPMSRSSAIQSASPPSGDFSLAERRPSERPRSHASLRPPSNEVDLLLDAGATDLTFELSTSLAPHPSSAPPPGRRNSGMHWAEGVANGPSAARAWPTGVTPHEDALRLDPLEVTITADYGQAPDGTLLMPLYALRVWQRQRELRALATAAQAELRAAEARRDDLLADFALHCRSALERNDRCRGLLTELERIEALTKERENALGRAEAGLEGTLSELRARSEALAQERALAAAALQNAEEVASRAAEVRSRHEAQSKRIEIERRAVLDVARQKLGPAGGALPPDLAAKLAELDAREAALAPETARLAAERDQVTSILRDAEAQLTTVDRIARQVEDDMRHVGARGRGELTQRTEGLGSAERERRAELVTVGRRVLETRGELFSVDTSRLDALHAADEAVRARLVHAVKLARALDAYDTGAAKKGRAVLAGMALFTLVLLALVVLR